MNAQTIDQLIASLREDTPVAKLKVGQRKTKKGKESVDRFVTLYTDLEFGWRAARIAAQRNIRFPLHLRGHDQWVFKAYMHLQDDRKWHNDHVAEAIALTSQRLETEAHVLQSLLVAKNANLAKIVEATSISPDTIICYEKLFFNVVDRKRDHMYIRNIIYPNGRLSETQDNNLDNQDLRTMLLRAGFNNGIDHARYFAGLGDDSLLKDLASREEASKQMDQMFMGNGLLLAYNGWLNQNSLGVDRARLLLAAQAQSGTDQQSNSEYLSMADTMTDELARLSDLHNQSLQNTYADMGDS